MSTDNAMLLSFYGDDFTGSTDAMEALARAGVHTILFISPPTPDQLARHRGVQAVGVAGLTRTMPPEAMARELEPAFTRLAALNTPVTHYKVCSTFDSSPTVGSIGRAMEIGQRAFAGRFLPLLVGAPPLSRYCVFGNLFARSGLDSEPCRLDRHPTMSRHPVTPMDEADLTRHLARQTDLPIDLFSVLHYQNEDAQAIDASLDALLADASAHQPRIVLFDALEPAHLRIVGRLIWQRSQHEQLMVTGSSGVEYALVEHWREAGVINDAPPRMTREPAERMIVLSGSCSPVTERQIRLAIDTGDFGDIPVDVKQLSRADTAQRERQRIVATMAAHLDAGHRPIAHLALGPDDPRIGAARDAGITPEHLAQWLGELGCEAVTHLAPQRTIITGGDTSGHVARAMGIEALTMHAPLAPGSPLCQAHGDGASADGIEIAFKGGQVGRDDIFVTACQGTSPC